MATDGANVVVGPAGDADDADDDTAAGAREAALETSIRHRQLCAAHAAAAAGAHKKLLKRNNDLANEVCRVLCCVVLFFVFFTNCVDVTSAACVFWTSYVALAVCY